MKAMEENVVAKRRDLFTPVFLLLLFLLGAGTFLLIKKNTPQQKKSSDKKQGTVVKRITSIPSQNVQGYMGIVRKDETELLLPKKNFELIAESDAKGQEVTGYDTIIEFDPALLSYVAIKNLLPQTFVTQVRSTEGKIAVSAFLKDTETLPLKMQKSQLFSVEMRALSPGRSALSIEFQKGSKSDSNLITASSQDILEKVSSINVVVGHEMMLQLGQTKEIPGTPYLLTLKDVVVPSQECRDCVERVGLVLTDDKEKEHSLAFQSGGFTGNIVNEIRSEGFLITLSELKEKSVILFVVPE